MKYTETVSEDFRWLSTVNQGRGKKCNYCMSAKTEANKNYHYVLLRPYPIYLGESYETVRSYGSSGGYRGRGKSYSSKAYHADFGCHRFTLEPIPAHLFINHFKNKSPRRLLTGLEVLREISKQNKNQFSEIKSRRDILKPQNNEWVHEIIHSDPFSVLFADSISKIEIYEWDKCWLDSGDNNCTCLKCKLNETVNQIKNNLDEIGGNTVTSGIEVGCIVEIITGAFKGEKARVTSVAETKEEVSMELFEQPIPMTLKMRGDHVKFIAESENEYYYQKDLVAPDVSVDIGLKEQDIPNNELGNGELIEIVNSIDDKPQIASPEENIEDLKQEIENLKNLLEQKDEMIDDLIRIISELED